jgi:adenylate kinase
METIDEIRRLVLEGQFELTAHARERMAERGVSTEDMISLIIDGEIIEDYPDDFPYPSTLIIGYILGDAFHVVAAKGKNLVKVVTVYRADEEIWLNHRTRKT